MPEHFIENTEGDLGETAGAAKDEVEHAIEATSRAIEAAPSHAIEQALLAIKSGQEEILSLLKHGIDTRTAEEHAHAAAEMPREAVEPVLELPEKQVRYVRRGLRKVKR